MRIGFNLPEAVENITITFEGHGKKKEYHFKNTEIQMFHDDRRLSNYINSFIGPDWPKSMIGKKSPRSKVVKRQVTAGKMSSLIADMTIKGASEEEMGRAVEFSAAVLNKNMDDDEVGTIYVNNKIGELEEKYASVFNREYPWGTAENS